MAPRSITSLAVSILAAAPVALAHFSIRFPEQKEPGNENSLDAGPCGGADLDFDAGPVDDFHVGGNTVWLEPSHPQSHWLFRVTTDETGQGNWTAGYEIVVQNGLGEVCMPMITAPKDYVGKTGLLGVVAKAEDGILYGCSQVKFVEGTGDMPDGCQNGTKNISFDNEASLAALVDDDSLGSSGSGGSNTSDTPEETDEPGAAASLYNAPAGLAGVLATVSVAVVVGASLIF